MDVIPDDVDIVRTDPDRKLDVGCGARTDSDAFDAALRDLLVDYFEEVDGQVRRHFPDRLPPLNVEEAVAGDLDRLRNAAIDRPLLVAVRDGNENEGDGKKRDWKKRDWKKRDWNKRAEVKEAERKAAECKGVEGKGAEGKGAVSTKPELVGTVQLKRLDATTAEVKRLYVAPPHRGAGIGRALMETLLEEAAVEGLETLRLGVAPYHDRARTLYADLGFEFTDQYAESRTPDPLVDDWGFMRYDREE